MFFIFGGAAVCFGQDETIAGGYVEADIANADVVAAANFAVKKRSKALRAAISLVTIEKAKTQVVAGMNYEVCMEVEVKRKSDKKADRQFARAVVYRNLKNKFSLTGWTVLRYESECDVY